MTTCTECGRQNRADFSFCEACGKPLVQGESFQLCSRCGMQIGAGFSFCGQCGAALRPCAKSVDRSAAAPPTAVELGKTYPESAAMIAERIGRPEGRCDRSEMPALLSRPAKVQPDRRAVTVIPQAAIAAAGAGSLLPDERHAPEAALPKGSLQPAATGPVPRPAKEELTTSHSDSRAVAAAGCPRLVSVNNDGTDGESFEVRESAFDVGRVVGHLTFAGDTYLSDLHCRLEKRGQHWYAQDLGSLNGVYMRLRSPRILGERESILAGTHVFAFNRVSREELDLKPAAQHGVMFFGSPLRTPWACLRVLATAGLCRDVRYVHRPSLSVGREGADWCFPDDEFMSRRHFEIALIEGEPQLRDMHSSNGTFVRTGPQAELTPGDLLRLGNQLLRFEFSAEDLGPAAK